MERGHAHRGQRGEVLDAQRLVVVAADPADRAGQVREAAVGQADLPDEGPLRAGDQPPEHLALDAGGEHGGVAGGVEQGEEPTERVEQRRGGGTDADADGVSGPGPGGGGRGRLGQQGGDLLRAQPEHEGQQRLARAGLDDVPDDRQLDRHEEELTGTVPQGAPAQRGFLDALGDDRQRRVGHVAQRLGGRGRAQDRDARQRGGREAFPRVPGDQLPEAVQLAHALSESRGEGRHRHGWQDRARAGHHRSRAGRASAGVMKPCPEKR